MDPTTWALIIAGASAAIGGASAVASWQQGQEELEISEESINLEEQAIQAEEKYREQQRQIMIAEMEAEVAALKETVGSLGAQAMYEYGKISEAGLTTYSAQRALTAFGGAEVGVGSPLTVMTGTLRRVQSDLSYKQGYYAAELSRRQAEIAGLEKQLGIIKKASVEYYAQQSAAAAAAAASQQQTATIINTTSGQLGTVPIPSTPLPGVHFPEREPPSTQMLPTQAAPPTDIDLVWNDGELSASGQITLLGPPKPRIQTTRPMTLSGGGFGSGW